LKNKLTYILFILFVFNTAFSQSFDKIQSEFLFAKQYYHDGNYYNAKVGMQKIAQEYKKNAFTDYANFYLALCAIKQKQFDDALTFLLICKSANKKWDKTDDINYQLGIVYFEKSDPLNALQAFSEVKNSSYQKNINEAKEYYLNKQFDLNILKSCYAFYSNDTSVVKVVYYKYKKTNPKSAEVAEFEAKHPFLKKQNITINTQISSISDDSQLKIALLLPFMLNDVDFSMPPKDVQFIYDYFEGFKMGLDSLKETGTTVEYATFDTKKDSSELNKVLKNNNFKNFDVVVGPAYNNQIRFFSKRFNEEIPIFAPFSKNLYTHEKENTVYLAEPSYETQAKKLAQFSFDSVAEKKASIIYGGALRDSLMAFFYKAEYEAKGGKIEQMIKIHKMDFTQSILAIKKIDYTTIGHVAFFASDESVARNFISVVDMRNTAMPIFAYSDLLEYQSIALVQFETRNFHFIHTDFINYESTVYQNFKKEYSYKIGILPSVYSYKGYEHALFLKNIKNIKEAEFTKGALFTGFEYNDKHDNQVVQITKLNKLVIKPVNYILSDKNE
jgi:outer membrane PBP1 activator LpoA protein